MKKRTGDRTRTRLHSFRLPNKLSERLGQIADDQETSDTAVLVRALTNHFKHLNEDPMLVKIIKRIGRVEQQLNRIINYLEKDDDSNL